MKQARDRADQIVRALLARASAHFIGGGWVSSTANATLAVVNPTDGQTIARVPAGNDTDVNRAVESAQAAFDGGWRDTNAEHRSEILWHTADLVEAEKKPLAVLASLETGSVIRKTSTFDVSATVAALRYYATLARSRAGVLHGNLGVHTAPFGVGAIVLSWTSPLFAAAHKIGAALAAGASVVVKPSKLAPLSVLRLVELMGRAGLPPGVVNVVTGLGGQAGEALALHSGVDALSFSGGVDAARRVLLSSAKSNLKKTHLTLHGKSAAIIFRDADLERAAIAVWRCAFTHPSGPGLLVTRAIVHEDVHDEFVSNLTERARQTIVGDPLDEHTELGPLIAEEHLKRALSFVDLGRGEGARLVAGGMRDTSGRNNLGWFLKPTVFMDVDSKMRIAKETIVAPVLCVLRFRKEEEAIDIANQAEAPGFLGLFGRDVDRARRVARRVRAGAVWINDFGAIRPEMPLGTGGLCGHGRDLGEAGLLQFHETRAFAG